MRSAADRHLLALLVVVSLGLTAFTLWAVARQGQALRERELADLRNAARAAALERDAALQADAEHLLEAVERVHGSGGDDELDTWVAGRSDGAVVAATASGEPWRFFPRTPGELTQPTTQPASAEAGVPLDLLSRLRDFQDLATDPDPLTRAGALVATAAVEQQLGRPLAAARIFAEAAQLFRATPHGAAHAFQAEAARVDSLLAAGDHDRASQALAELFETVRTDHPARLGTRETAQLARQLDQLGLTDDDALRTLLAELQTRAARRAQILAACEPLLSDVPTGGRPRTVLFLTSGSTASEPVVVATRNYREPVRFAIVWPAARLLAAYWKPSGQAPRWHVALRPVETGLELVRLGPQFAHAALEPTATAALALRARDLRQTALIVATALGMAGAWGLVVWTLRRVVRRQRELARLQGRFVADVSHELKTPLALIRLCAETLAEGRVREPTRVKTYHETIVREGERLSLLLDNILDLGRIESGRKVYAFGPCDVAAVARQAWTLFEPRFVEEAFDARLELAPDLPTIRADAAALQQVLVNLLQNAHRYAGEGKHVRLTVWREGFVILFRVEDRGLGMTPAQLERLGESFFRADDARVRQTRGVGLGLAIANHIVTAHRGKIDVQSRPGQGSTFTVWIPFEPGGP